MRTLDEIEQRIKEKKRHDDLELLEAAARLTKDYYEPTPMQRKWDLFMTYLWMYLQARKAVQD